MATFQNTFPVGTVLHSMLTLTQFQTAIGSLGNGWVLANGQSCVGSTYHAITGFTTVPDMRGRFLRGKNNGATTNPDGDLALGTNTSDKFRSHVHQQQFINPFGVPGAVTPSTKDPGSSYSNVGGSGNDTLYGGGALNTVSSGSNETAPYSTTVNIFIKIN